MVEVTPLYVPRGEPSDGAASYCCDSSRRPFDVSSHAQDQKFHVETHNSGYTWVSCCPVVDSSVAPISIRSRCPRRSPWRSPAVRVWLRCGFGMDRYSSYSSCCPSEGSLKYTPDGLHCASSRVSNITLVSSRGLVTCRGFCYHYRRALKNV